MPIRQKKPLHTGMRTGLRYLISLSVCLCMCNIRRFYWLRELYETDCHKLGIYGSGRVWANAWDVFRRTPSRGGHSRRAAVDFVVCFGCGGTWCFFCFSSNAHGLSASMRLPCVIYLFTRKSVQWPITNYLLAVSVRAVLHKTSYPTLDFMLWHINAHPQWGQTWKEVNTLSILVIIGARQQPQHLKSSSDSRVLKTWGPDRSIPGN